MAIVACWECGKDISSSAPSCPACGAPSKRTEAPATIVVERRDDMIFEGGGSRITTTTALINGRTYAINGVTAVDITRKNLDFGKIVGAIVCGVLAFIFAGHLNVVALILGLFCVAAFAAGVYRPYFLVLRTAAGDTMALESSGVGLLAPLREAIETAIRQRG